MKAGFDSSNRTIHTHWTTHHFRHIGLHEDRKGAPRNASAAGTSSRLDVMWGCFKQAPRVYLHSLPHLLTRTSERHYARKTIKNMEQKQPEDLAVALLT